MNTKVVIVKTSRFSVVDFAGSTTPPGSSSSNKTKSNESTSNSDKDTNVSNKTSKKKVKDSNTLTKTKATNTMDSTPAPASAGEGASKEGKTLSKNEMKKLAKKAEKEAKKKAKAAATAPPSASSSNDKKEAGNASVTSSDPTSTPTPTPKKRPSKVVYFLAKASKDDDSMTAASLKASIASVVYGVPLSRPTSKTTTIPPFIHGPVLYTNTDPSNFCFGGNGVAKALSLIGTKQDKHDAIVVDEFLELERKSLRPSCPTKVKTKALQAIEAQLSIGSNLHLVGDSITPADISVVVTLSQAKDLSSYSPVIQTYVNYHMTSNVFTQGMELLDSTLLPPPKFDLDSNPSLIQAVNSVFEEAISSFVTSGDDVVANKSGLMVEKCKQLKFGDYQCKEAMPLFSKLKSSQSLPDGIKSPQQLAQAIIDKIPDNPVVDNIVMNGPGFILCRVKPSYLQHHLNRFMNSSKDGASPKVPIPLHLSDSKNTVVVDFSSPNIAKEMHVGHLRSTIIGESVCRILEFVGSDVKRVNHVGDWGTQFGMLITYLKETCPGFGKGGSSAGASNITDLTVFYKNAKKRFDEDAEFKETSRLNVVKLQAGDEECRAMWQVLCDISRVEFEKVYKRLDITLEECGESFYNDKIPAVVDEFVGANACKEEEGGAKVVFVPKYKIPLMLVKSDGGYGYDSTDMAALKYRLFDLNASRVVCITDFGQGDHFQMIFSAGEKIGWVDPKKHMLEHIGFGTVMGEDGKRFKTRSGDTVRLVDLLDEAVSRMEKSLLERIAEGKAVITADDVPEVAAAMGYGAVKYFDLRRNPTSNYKFNYDEMLDTRGNTAIYLLYANARLESICSKGKEKHGIDVDELVKKNSVKISVEHPSERNLALHLQMFADMIDDVLKDLYPYRVCDFLYALSNAVSDFVTQCKVLDSPEMESRLLLCRASSIVMRECFHLLGIRSVDRI